VHRLLDSRQRLSIPYLLGAALAGFVGAPLKINNV
jgi:hypothetical protein